MSIVDPTSDFDDFSVSSRAPFYRQADVVIICAEDPNYVMYENVLNNWLPELKFYNPDCPVLLVDVMDDEEKPYRSEREYRCELEGISSVISKFNRESEWHKFVECDLQKKRSRNRVFEQVSNPRAPTSLLYYSLNVELPC